MNLDPAAEVFHYPVAVDIRELITVEDAMEMMHFGPNGGLIYCMEFLLSRSDWLEEAVGDFNDDYLIFDCPGQIELYMHLPVVKNLTAMLVRLGYTVASVYIVDALFVTEPAKFVSANLMCLSAMLQLELPHISVLTKIDLLKAQGSVDEETLETFLSADPLLLMDHISASMDPRYVKLTGAIAELLESFSMVSFVPLDISDPESVEFVLSSVDYIIQYGEDLEIKEPRELDDDPDQGEYDQNLLDIMMNRT